VENDAPFEYAPVAAIAKLDWKKNNSDSTQIKIHFATHRAARKPFGAGVELSKHDEY
jgi:hypothetical protein